MMDTIIIYVKMKLNFQLNLHYIIGTIPIEHHLRFPLCMRIALVMSPFVSSLCTVLGNINNIAEEHLVLLSPY